MSVINAPFLIQNANGSFVHVHSEFTLEQWADRIDLAFEKAEASFKALILDHSLPNIENTFIEMENIVSSFNTVVTPFFAIYGAHTLASWEELNGKVSARNTEMFTRFYQDDSFYQRCRLAADCVPESLSDDVALLIHNNMLSFKNSGMDLNEEERIKIAGFNASLNASFNDFERQNMKNGNSFLVFTAEELSGVPQDVLNSLAEKDESGNITGYRVSMQMLFVDSIICFIENRDVREKIFKTCANRGLEQVEGKTYDTRPVIENIMSVRRKRASLLGYSNVAAHLLSDTMAGSSNNVMKMFQDTLLELLPKLDAELAEFSELAKQDSIETLQAWDLDYYMNKCRNANFNVDEREVSQYLSLDNIREGAFLVAGRLFDLTFEEVEVKTYHELVKTYLVRKNDKAIGYFSVDDFLRPEKRPGAWMTEMHPFAKDQLPWIMNVCNFQPSSNGEPVLLSFDDALTVFHELGHGLHALLSQAKYPSQWGTNVLRDFVELPSQLLENWMCSADSLRLFARHYQTNAPIPEELLNNLISSRNFGDSVQLSRYCYSAIQDLLLHKMTESNSLDLLVLEERVRSFAKLPEQIEPRHRFFHFSHLFSGDSYASQYYCYHWAGVLEKSVFNQFKKLGVFNKELAQKLEEFIYSPGGSRAPDVLFQEFMSASLDVEKSMQ